MSSDTVIFLELTITLGIVAGFGLWELHKLKRDKDHGGDKRE